MCPYEMPRQFYPSGIYLNLTYLIWPTCLSSSMALLPVDQRVLKVFPPLRSDAEDSGAIEVID